MTKDFRPGVYYCENNPLTDYLTEVIAEMSPRSIEADFKSVEKKFTEQGESSDDIKTYLDRFKKLRNEHRITDTKQRDIDYWGKKPFADFRHFVNKLSQEKSKRQTKKDIHKVAQNIKGAKLIAENEQWLMYNITSYEASEKLGSRNWCIVRDEHHWNDYSAKENFYFFLSLTLDKEDRFYKIALAIDAEGTKTYWDNLDRPDKSIPSSLNIPPAKTEPFSYSNLTEEQQINAMKRNATHIQFIENPSEQVQMAAVNKNIVALKYIENPSEAIQLAAVAISEQALLYIKDPSEEVQLAAVAHSFKAIYYIKDPSEEVQLKAVSQGGGSFLLEHTNIEPSEKVQIAIIENNWGGIQFIKDPCEKAKEKLVEKLGSGAFSYIEPSHALKQLAQQKDAEVVKRNPLLIELMPDPTEEIQLIAIETSLGRAIENIKNPTKKVQLEAVKIDGKHIQYIKNPSYEVQEEAIKQNGWAIVYIKEPPLELMRIAVKQAPDNIRAIKREYNDGINENCDAPEEIQLLAVNQRPELLKYFKDPTEKVQLAAIDGITNMRTISEMYYAFMKVYWGKTKMPEEVQLALTKKIPGILQLMGIKNITEEAQKLANEELTKRQEYAESSITIADFKAVEKKFLTTITDKDLVKDYLKKFKSLRDQNRIPEGDVRHLGNNKDIDVWGKRGFEAFKNFVDEIAATKSKTEVKKSIHKEAQKIEGAELVAENDEWLVYRIHYYEAAKLLGSRNWCIVRDESTWDEYSGDDPDYISIFYFVLSKDRPEDEWHKIAIQADSNRSVIIWDNLDKNRRDINIYNSLGVPKFDIVFPEPICPTCGEHRDFCNCCGECGNPMEHCTCCSICGSRNADRCGCCQECEKPDTDCNCCSVCGDTDKDDCGCCQKCDNLAGNCTCDKAKASVKIRADYKTVQKKFIDQGIDQSIVKQYLDDFKKLRDSRDLGEHKDIDKWGKKPWNEFKEFVDKTKETKSKSEEKKLKKMEGAELVAENDDWLIYKIMTHKAAMLYGSGTRWCITDTDGINWKKYTKRRNCFYFCISKKLEDDNKYYKLAVQVNYRGTKIYWDSTDTKFTANKITATLPKFDMKYFDIQPEKSTAKIETCVQKLKEYIEQIKPERVNEDIDTLYGVHLDNVTDTALEEKAQNFLNSCRKNEIDDNDIESIFFSAAKEKYFEDVEIDVPNEIAYYTILPSEIHDANLIELLDNLQSDELREVESRIFEDVYFEAGNYIIHFNDKISLILNEDLLDRVIEKESKENKENKESKKVSALYRVAADFKSVQKKFVDQGIDEGTVKQYLDTFKALRDKRDLGEHKDIDQWGKKPWDEFKEFVDKTKEEKTKTQVKILQKMEGAELVYEDDDWFIYRIHTFDAAKLYGSGTAWCITEITNWACRLHDNRFYFMISKKRTKQESFFTMDYYKIAVQCHKDGRLTFWSANDIDLGYNFQSCKDDEIKNKIKELQHKNIFTWFERKQNSLTPS